MTDFGNTSAIITYEEKNIKIVNQCRNLRKKKKKKGNVNIYKNTYEKKKKQIDALKKTKP